MNQQYVEKEVESLARVGAKTTSMYLHNHCLVIVFVSPNGKETHLTFRLSDVGHHVVEFDQEDVDQLTIDERVEVVKEVITPTLSA